MQKRKSNKKELKNIEKIDIIIVIVLVIAVLLLVDFLDINEKIGFPINILDEPLLILMGIVLGYLIAKFRFLRIIKKFTDDLIE